MSVLLSRDVRVGGAINTAGTVVHFGEDFESTLVGRGDASPVRMPALEYPYADLPATRGYRAVLFGDSMTDLADFILNGTASYDRATGTLTVTESASHRIGTGWPVTIWSYSYSSLAHKREVIATRTSNTVWTTVLEDRPADLPDGALTGTFFSRYWNRRNLQSWVVQLQMLMGWPFDIVHNGGQSGNTSWQALERVQRDCLRYRPDVVFMQSPGINDQATSNGAVAEEVTWRYLEGLYCSIVDSGAHLVLLNITPVFTGEARATLRNMERVMSLNRRIADFCRRTRNVTLIDAWRLVYDAASATGLAASGKLKTADNIHYNVPTAYAVAKAVQSALSGFYPAQLDRRPRGRTDCFAGSAVSVTNGSTSAADGVGTIAATAHGFRVGEQVGLTGATGGATGLNGWWRVLSVVSANAFTVAINSTATFSAAGTITASRHRNLFPNPVLNNAASGGTVSSPVTGTAAQYLNVQNLNGTATVAASVVADADGFGNWQRLRCSVAAEGDSWGFQNTNITSLLVGQVAAGRAYRAGVTCRVASAGWANTPVEEIYGEIVIQLDSAYTVNIRMCENYEAGVIGFAEDKTFYLATDTFVIPQGTVTQVYFQCWVRAGGTVSANLDTEWTGLLFEQVAP